MNYFQGNKNHPQHLSVGAVVINDKSEILVHHVNAPNEPAIKGYWSDQGLTDFYTLMRETIEQGETLEGALERGLVEEFGVTAEIKDYLGSIKSHWNHEETNIEKTTVYFLCHLISQDDSKRNGDEGSRTKLEWQTADFLIPKMKDQALKYNRTDVDESLIIERAKKYF